MAKFKVEEGVRTSVNGQPGEVLNEVDGQWRFRSDAGHVVSFVDPKDFDDAADEPEEEAPTDDAEKPTRRTRTKG